MRPIKFRGKSVRNGEWAYGYLVKREDSRHCWIIKDFLEYPIPQSETICDIETIEVIPETVGQYYGKDDSGNEMYEHDVCEVDSWNPSIHGIFFNREGFCMGYAECYCYHDCKYLEKGHLIGNLHDNEELRLKVLNPEIEKELARFYCIKAPICRK